jgi:hypothetical protein
MRSWQESPDMGQQRLGREQALKSVTEVEAVALVGHAPCANIKGKAKDQQGPGGAALLPAGGIPALVNGEQCETPQKEVNGDPAPPIGGEGEEDSLA